MKIVKARITEQPKCWTDPLPEVHITLEDGTEKLLYSYFPDELSFTAEEFEGLTEEEATRLKYDRDVAWLRS